MPKRRKIDSKIIILGIIALLLLCSLLVYFIIKNQSPKVYSPQMANPASVYCVENGGELEIRINEDGQYGVCTKNGNSCEEWAFYRGECIL